MLPPPVLSDSGPLDYGVTPDGDEDVFTLRFDEAPYLALPLTCSALDAGDRAIEAGRAYVEAVLGRPLADYAEATSPFPLFAVWAVGVEAGPGGVLLNNRPAGAPPPPAATY